MHCTGKKCTFGQSRTRYRQEMRIKRRGLAYLFMASLLCTFCQQRPDESKISQNEEVPSFAVLSKSKYTIGDTIPVEIKHQLTEEVVTWDDDTISFTRQGNILLVVPSATSTVGFHQVAVSGVRAGNKKSSDAMGVELLSDIIPEKLQYEVAMTYPHDVNSFT